MRGRSVVSYFAAVLAREDEDWVAAEVDLDEVETLEDVDQEARGALLGEAPDADDELMVLLVEQGEEWFGVVRLELDDDPRVFVSDAGAALRHALGETLLPDLVPPPAELDDVSVSGAVAQPGEEEGGAGQGEDPVRLLTAAPPDLLVHPTGPAGDDTVLADLGVPPDTLEQLAGAAGSPSEALDELAARMGAADALEAVR